MERNFKHDLAESNNFRTEWEEKIPIVMKLVDRHFKVEKIKWKDEIPDQYDYHVDGIIYLKNGRRFTFDHKTRNEKYYQVLDYLLEITHLYYSKIVWYDNNKVNWSETKQYRLPEMKKEGWLYHCAELIFMGTVFKDDHIIPEIFCFSANPFKQRNFSQKLESFPKAFAGPTKFNNNLFQMTMNVRIPKWFLEENADYKAYFISNEV